MICITNVNAGNVLGFSYQDIVIYQGIRHFTFARFAGYERVRQGPIHFAGEHCSLEMQGYMEGAAREGARAARELLQDQDQDQDQDFAPDGNAG